MTWRSKVWGLAPFILLGCSSPKTTTLDCVRTATVAAADGHAQFHSQFKFTDTGIEIQSDDSEIFPDQPPKYTKTNSVERTAAQALIAPQLQLNDGESAYDVFARNDGQTGVQLMIGQKLQGDARTAGSVWVLTGSLLGPLTSSAPTDSQSAQQSTSDAVDTRHANQTGIIYTCQKKSN